MSDGIVYFIQAENDGPIKIGYTTDPQTRYSTIQLCCPLTLFLLGEVAGNLEDEAVLHHRFSSSWVRGEWFEPCAELLAYISDVSTLDERKLLTGEPIRRFMNIGNEHSFVVDPAIDQIGAELGVSDAARKKWPQRGVPHKWRLPILQMAANRGLMIGADDFAAKQREAANV